MLGTGLWGYKWGTARATATPRKQMIPIAPQRASSHGCGSPSGRRGLWVPLTNEMLETNSSHPRARRKPSHSFQEPVS